MLGQTACMLQIVLCSLKWPGRTLYVVRSRFTDSMEMFMALTRASRALGSFALVSSSRRNRPMAKKRV